MKIKKNVSPSEVPFDMQSIQNVKERLNWNSKDRVINPTPTMPEMSLNAESYSKVSKENFDRFNSYPTKKSLFSGSRSRG